MMKYQEKPQQQIQKKRPITNTTMESRNIHKTKDIVDFKFPIMMPVAAFCLFCADDLFNSGFISDTTIGLTLGMIAGIMYSWLHNNFNL